MTKPFVSPPNLGLTEETDIEEFEVNENLSIQTFGLKKYFGRGYNLVKAVDGIDLSVKEGEIHGFLGPNGAGKTTSMLMLAGTLRPTEGKGYIFGKPIGTPAANKQLGVAIANPRFWKSMSAYKYLVFMGQLAGLDKTFSKHRAKEFLHILEMTKHGHRLPVAFSTGMKAKLAVAQALMHHPRVAILDESTAGLDPESRFKLVNTIKELAQMLGVSIFVSGHILTEIEKLVTRCTIIVKGKIGLTTTIQEMRKEFSTGQYALECTNPQNVMNDMFNLGMTSQIFMDHHDRIIFQTDFIDYVYAQLPEILKRNGSSLMQFGPLEVTLEEVFINVISKKYGSDFLFEEELLDDTALRKRLFRRRRRK
ncbi:MAG: ABC transporter ATP-binding protein [Asgard group archaeon]|nr:ABC transporter ATP-binding protein [Asgard group archaeon]